MLSWLLYPCGGPALAWRMKIRHCVFDRSEYATHTTGAVQKGLMFDHGQEYLLYASSFLPAC